MLIYIVYDYRVAFIQFIGSSWEGHDFCFMSIILEPHFPRYGLITLSAQYSNRLDAIWLIIGDWLLLLLLSHVVFHHLRLGDHSLQFLHLSVKPHFEFLSEAELIIVLF